MSKKKERRTVPSERLRDWDKYRGKNDPDAEAIRRVDRTIRRNR